MNDTIQNALGAIAGGGEVRIVSGENARPHAIVEEATGLVVNKIMWDAAKADLDPMHAYDPGPGNKLIELEPGSPVYLGWTYADGAFSPPNPET